MEVAQTLADVATAHLLNAQARQDRTELVAAISYELRTPMTSITGHADLLTHQGAGSLNPAQQRYVDTIRRNAERLRGLADAPAGVVANLLGNAVKFTLAGGWVRCRLGVDGARAVLEVSDNGLGIPDEEQQALFTRFFRASPAHTHAIQGSGLGLTIVSSIVKSHGGEISVVSEHLRGSTFTVSLPLVMEGASEDHAVPQS